MKPREVIKTEDLPKVSGINLDEANEVIKNLSFSDVKHILISKQVFLGCFLARCNFRWDKTMPTACVSISSTGKLELRINYDFFESLEGLSKVGVVLHEMLHLVNGHLEKLQVGVFSSEPTNSFTKYITDQRLFNIAADMAINQFIPVEWLWKNPEPILPKMFELPEGQSSEFYYQALVQKREESEDEKRNAPGKGGKSKGDDGEEGETEFEKTIKDIGPIDSHDWNTPTDPSEGATSKSVIKSAIDSMIRTVISDVKQVYRGQVDSHIQKIIDERFKPTKKNWKHILKKFCGSKTCTEVESTRNKLNRRLHFKAPGLKKMYSPKILIAVDSSGSVRDIWFASFMSQIKKILGSQDERVEIIFFDSKVCDFKMKIRNLKSMPRRPASGGTCFQAPMDYAIKAKPDLFIILTDGGAPVPTKPRFPVLWAVIKGESHEHLNFGQKIILDEINPGVNGN